MVEGFPGSVVASRAYSQRSPSEPFPVASKPCPPKSQRFPWVSLHAAQSQRAPGTLVEAATPCVPKFPGVLVAPLDPLIHVHCLATGSNFHRSLKPFVPLVNPPNIQKLPLLSTQATDAWRPGGTFPAAAVPCVPYVPAWLPVLAPLTQVHWPPL